MSSEFESAFAGGVCESLDSPMKQIATAIEDHLGITFRRRPLGNSFPHRLRCIDVGAGLEDRAYVLLERGSGHERLASRIVDHLRIDMLRGTKHRKPRTIARRAAHIAPHLGRSPFGSVRDRRHGPAPPYFFLPSLRKMYSPAYLTPLPL